MNVRVITHGGEHIGVGVAQEGLHTDIGSHQHKALNKENIRKMEQPLPTFDAYQQKEFFSRKQEELLQAHLEEKNDFKFLLG